MSVSTQSAHPSALMYPLPIRRLRDVLARVLPNDTLTSVTQVPSTRLAALYTLTFTSTRRLTLTLAPSPVVSLLRHEHRGLTSEVALVTFVRDTLKLGPPSASSLAEHKATSPPSTLSSPASREREGKVSVSKLAPEPVNFLSRLVPALLRHGSNTKEIGYPYTIYDMITGDTLSTLSIYLSLPERRHLDIQIGNFVRQLALLTSPNGKFGTLIGVCGDPSRSPTQTADGSGADNGTSRWLTAFRSLMEGILRDGEDMAVLLPYAEVRAHFARLSWRFDDVKIPRLVVLDADDDNNLLIERDPEDLTRPLASDTVRVTGLRDWSQGYFGDPLLSSVFEQPSEAFLVGWEGDHAGSNDGLPTDLIQDQDSVYARMLLYKCYRAIVVIVTQYYRPHPDSSRRELEGRRTLTSTLADLERTHTSTDDRGKRPRSSSRSDAGETSKRKRLSRSNLASSVVPKAAADTLE
ncbi:MAG: hypothetical protein M1818_007864 [Claussenomyces sp. TS43310]|nr:MAG: hypothetical protein M1818_007864 [Claussenomyces sp. TS43310]